MLIVAVTIGRKGVLHITRKGCNKSYQQVNLLIINKLILFINIVNILKSRFIKH